VEVLHVALEIFAFYLPATASSLIRGAAGMHPDPFAFRFFLFFLNSH